MTNWKTYEKLADQLLGIKREGNLLVDGYQSNAYQYKFAETKQLSDNYPYQTKESETILQLRQDVQDRILEIAKNIAAPVQLKVLQSFLELNCIAAVAKKMEVTPSTIGKSLFAYRKDGSLVKRIQKILLTDITYLDLNRKLKDILE